MPRQRQGAARQATLAMPASPPLSELGVEAGSARPSPKGRIDRKTVAYMLAPALAFMLTFNVAPVLMPAFFAVPDTNRTDRRKVVFASGAAATLAFLAVRCVM